MTHLNFFKKQKAMFLRHTLTKNYNGTYWPLVVYTDMVIIFGNNNQNGLIVVSFFEWNNCFTSDDMDNVSENIV